MRKEVYRMGDNEARALVAAANVIHLASVKPDGTPLLRTLNAVVVDGAVCFHGAPAGEKIEALGRPTVVSAERVIASIPSYFIDPERACPATTLYLSAEAHGTLEEVTDARIKARVIDALMAKYQPEGGHVPIDIDHPLYAKPIRGLLVAQLRLDRIDGKAKVAQNRTPQERTRLCEKLWQRGAPGDAEALETILAFNPDTPLPSFLQGPHDTRLIASVQPTEADRAAELLDGAYWNGDVTRTELAAAHLGSQAWVGARDSNGTLVATARALSDGAKHAWIYDVMVAPEWRNRGLGFAVVKLALEHPAVRTARKVHLGTRDAHGLYRKFGFIDESEMPPRGYTSSTMHLARPPRSA